MSAVINETKSKQAPVAAKPGAVKNVAIVGATGYTGQELVRLLLQHPEVQIACAASHSNNGKSYASVYPGFQSIADFVCQEGDLAQIASQVDLIFLALPHGQAASKVDATVLEKCKVIDLSADFRLDAAADYKSWYAFEHPQPALLEEAVYGLPELNRIEIASASLIANPGCYATCSILTLAPLVKANLIELDSLVIDAKSGVSGAGRGFDLGVHFNECNESIKAYKVGCHRHTPEIEQVLAVLAGQSFCTSFTPHLVPMNRGILVTAYAKLASKISQAEILEIYRAFFKDEPFVRLFTPQSGTYSIPETRFVKGSNFCDIGLTVDARTNRVIAVGAIDNLVKGAAGQAIQNMNLLFGWAEATGLQQAPIFPA
ncbi:MAG: N-acetyl-gamma-glutamyl-phosphate reductase [Cyanobacteria bacterium REEB67]|nr:N-acetyl-gamma-glutamyl-phosphate reductase [Cyanobacteria bacterium REEB67]